MSDPRETLARIGAQADAATEGPWAPWLDQDGTPHMNGMLMVGNAAAVIPEGESWIEGVDVNPVAHTYTPEDREFIAAARTNVPRLAGALEAVLKVHQPFTWDFGYGPLESCKGCADQGVGNHDYPCPTVEAVTRALEGDTND